MSFESLSGWNYITEDTDNLSIQDTCDILGITHDNVSRLRNEVLMSHSSCVVNISDSDSYLNFRDQNGDIISGSEGRIRNNTELSLRQGIDPIYTSLNGENKFFIPIKLSDGSEGFVSADFLKLPDSPSNVTPTPPSPEAPPRRTIPRRAGILPGIPSIPSRQIPQADSPRETTPETPYSGERGTYRDGEPLLIGEDGSELNLDIREVQSLGNVYPGFTEFLQIWLSKATREANTLTLRRFVDDDEIIESSVASIESLIPELFMLVNLPQRNQGEEQRVITEIFSHITTAEGQETILSNTQDILDVIFHGSRTNPGTIIPNPQLSDAEIRHRVYGLSREGFIDHGNSPEVQNMLANEIISEGRFPEIMDLLSDPSIITTLINGDKTELSRQLEYAGINEGNGWFRENRESLVDQIIEKFYTIDSRIRRSRNRGYFQEQLVEINASRAQRGEEALTVDDLIDAQVRVSALEFMKHSLLRARISQMEDRGEPNTFLRMYAGVMGLSRIRGPLNDFVNISDSNIDNVIDMGFMAVTSLATMGIGAIAARGALGVVRIALSGTKLMPTASAVRFLGAAGIEGFSFYEASLIAQNTIFSEEAILEGAGNGYEIMKSIAFMGVLRGVSIFRNTPRVRSMYEAIPSKYMKPANIATILTEAGLITTTSQGIEVLFGEEWNWTWNEYIQALVLIGAMRGSSHLVGRATQASNPFNYYRVQKDAHGNIEVIPRQSAQTPGRPAPTGVGTRTKGGRQQTQPSEGTRTPGAEAAPRSPGSTPTERATPTQTGRQGRPEPGAPRVPRESHRVSRADREAATREPAFQNFTPQVKEVLGGSWGKNGWKGSGIMRPVQIPMNGVSRLTQFFMAHPTKIVNNIRRAEGIPNQAKEALASIIISPNHANQGLIRNIISTATGVGFPASATLLDTIVREGDGNTYRNLPGSENPYTDFAEEYFLWNVVGMRIAIIYMLANNYDEIFL